MTRATHASRALLALALLTGVACTREEVHRPQIANADADRGRVALAQYGCGACHVIPGVRGAVGRTGPALTGYSRFVYLAGKFPNQPDLLVRWIADAPSLAPRTAMPAIPMPEQQARDMAAYLYSLE